MDHVFASCSAQPSCATTFPTLAQDFAAVYDELNAKPIDVVFETASGSPTVHFDGDRMMRALHSRFARSVSRVPLFISELRRGDRNKAARLLLGNYSVAPGDNQLTNFVFCFESGGPDVNKDVIAAARAQTRPQFRVLLNTGEECPLLQERFALPADRDWVTSDIPTLIITQEFDDRTPTDHGQRIAAHLTHAYLFEEPAHAHGQPPSPCALSIMWSFLGNPASKPDGSCLASDPPLVFETKNLERMTIVFSIVSDGQLASPLAGTWEGNFPDAPVIYKLDLKASGAQLTGAINTGAQSVPIFDGRVEGQTMTFKVASPDGDRTITFTGRLAGDSIVVTRDATVRPGGAPGGAALFGLNAAHSFTLTRSK
jgi:hypothetical protein